MNFDIDPAKPILPISALAEELKVHQRTLRIYDKEGILIPTRTDKNRRLYSYNDLEKGKLILFLTRNLAVNLTAVKVFLKLFEKYQINSEEINTIALLTGIDEAIQKENIEKTSKRGRKPKIL